MNKIILWALCATLLFACSSSDKEAARYTKYDDVISNGKPLAMGDEKDVYLFCDKENWAALKPFIQSSIEREFILVYPEKYFTLIPKDISELDEYFNYRNLLFIGDLESGGRVSQHMIESLAPEFITRVRQSGGDLFIAKNHASRDQLTLYLLGSSPLNLEKIGAIQSDKIFELLLRRFTQRQGYQTYQQPVIPDSFFETYPFSLKIPNNYTLYSNDKEGRFLSFIYRARAQNREIPDKYVNVYYEDMPENKIDHEWLITKRQMLGEKYFEGDVFDEDLIRKERTKLAGHDAWRIVGAWQNEKHLIGGAFQSYAFWHEGRAYIVDNIVYFPAGNKLPILAELYVISSSIELK
ncbi:MAG: hypothetical protein PWP64_503 [Candidatus Cloacimonadota bacterium]|nr:hypothetical protein [Candidatus Cloacimonadota bacterium]